MFKLQSIAKECDLEIASNIESEGHSYANVDATQNTVTDVDPSIGSVAEIPEVESIEPEIIDTFNLTTIMGKITCPDNKEYKLAYVFREYDGNWVMYGRNIYR